MAEGGVEIRLKTKVNGYVDDKVQLSDGSSIAAKTLLWTAGVSPSPLVEPLPCRKEKGGIAVDEYLEVPQWPGVWALGDCATIPTRTSGQFYPPTAQHAQAASKILAENIRAAIRGGDKKPFVFRELGKMAVIGRRSGVANVLGVDISGLIAWAMWRFLNRSLMPGTERKLRITLDWGLDLLSRKTSCRSASRLRPSSAPSPDTKPRPSATSRRQRQHRLPIGSDYPCRTTMSGSIGASDRDQASRPRSTGLSPLAAC
jgi:NADH dehydrogenase